jgi:Ca2+-binding EF-hand superfamily protein
VDHEDILNRVTGVFSATDKDNDGTLSFKEFGAVYTVLRKEGIVRPGVRKLAVFADIDRDRSRGLSFMEVRNYAIGLELPPETE